MKLTYLALAALLILLPASASAQFPNSTGGPAAIGQAMATKDDAGKVTVVQAPAQSTGLLKFSAFGWLEPYVESLVNGMIAVGFAVFAKGRYSTMLDDSSRNALETFVKNRASSLIADGFVKIQDKAIDVHSAALATEAAKASALIPGALKRFGLTPEVIAGKIIDAIPQTQAGAAMIANAHPAVTEPVKVS